MNIIYDEKLIPSFTSVKNNSEASYKPNELIFYVPHTYSDYSVCIIVQNGTLYCYAENTRGFSHEMNRQ